jgi:acyl-CoA thioesterase-1
LGDSIRLIGYGTKVPELLGEDYQVFQPEDNCRFVKYTLRMLFDLKSEIEGSDVIHWNNGLWDIPTGLFDDGEPFTNVEEYVQNMLRVAKELKKLGKRVIFATTTPVHEDKKNLEGPIPPAHRNEDIIRYNSAILKEFEKEDIYINDLHSLMYAEKEKYLLSDMIHPNPDGIKVLGRAVADSVLSVKEIEINRERREIQKLVINEKTVQ